MEHLREEMEQIGLLRQVRNSELAKGHGPRSTVPSTALTCMAPMHSRCFVVCLFPITASKKKSQDGPQKEPVHT